MIQNLSELKKQYSTNCLLKEQLGENWQDHKEAQEKLESVRQSNREFYGRMGDKEKGDFDYCMGSLEI
jgi:hypothetical protein